MTDAVTGMLSVIGILQALYERERTTAEMATSVLARASRAAVAPTSKGALLPF